MVSKDIINFKKGETVLTTQDVQELLEYRDVFIKLLDVAIISIKAQLGNCELAGKEGEAYSSIVAFNKLKNDINSLEKVYKSYIDGIDNK